MCVRLFINKDCNKMHVQQNTKQKKGKFRKSVLALMVNRHMFRRGRLKRKWTTEKRNKGIREFHCMSVQYDKYIYYNQHYAHDWSRIKSHYLKPLKTTYYLLHVSIPIGSSSGMTVPYYRSYCVGLLTGKVIW